MTGTHILTFFFLPGSGVNLCYVNMLHHLPEAKYAHCKQLRWCISHSHAHAIFSTQYDANYAFQRHTHSRNIFPVVAIWRRVRSSCHHWAATMRCVEHLLFVLFAFILAALSASEEMSGDPSGRCLPVWLYAPARHRKSVTEKHETHFRNSISYYELSWIGKTSDSKCKHPIL